MQFIAVGFFELHHASTTREKCPKERQGECPLCDSTFRTVSQLTIPRTQANGDQDQDSKKPRRSQRIANSQSSLAVKHKTYLPSPLTHQDSTATEYKESTATPPAGRPSQIRQHTPVSEAIHAFSSPPGDTQALSQYPPGAFAPDVVDEAEEGVWGYLFPLDSKFGDSLVLKKRDSCSSPANPSSCRTSRRGKARPCAHETPGGYLVGRHPECGEFSRNNTIVFPANADLQTLDLRSQRYPIDIA